MKPRLCRSSRRAFASTHPLIIPSTSPREALLACPPSPPGNLLSFTVESTLSSPCSHSDPPLTCQGAALAHLDSLPLYDLVLWTDSSVPLPFGKDISGVLANCFLCGTDATLSFSAGPVCSNFSAEACTILHALCWVAAAPTSLPFLFSSYLTLVLFLPPCPLLHLSFYFKLFGRSGKNRLLSPPVLLGYSGSLDIHFSQGTTWLMSWPDGERYLHPLQSLVVSLLLSLVSTLFSDWQQTVSSKFFNTQVPSIATQELMLPCSTHCVCSCLHCNGHSLLLSFYLCSIGRIESPSCRTCGHLSQDTSHLILHCLAMDSLATLGLSTTSGPGPGKLPDFWGSMVFHLIPNPQKGSGNQQ